MRRLISWVALQRGDGDMLMSPEIGRDRTRGRDDGTAGSWDRACGEQLMRLLADET